MIYQRTESRVVVEWKPNDEELGEQAMQEIVGETQIEIDADTSVKVRERYQELHVNKYGQESPYYDDE